MLLTGVHPLGEDADVLALDAVDGLVAGDEGQVGLGGDVSLATVPLEVLHTQLGHQVLEGGVGK